MANYIYGISLIGLFLAVYATMVERRARTEKNYRAVCDISKRASCTKAFTSRYGSHFGIPNGIFGLVFYLAIIVLVHFTLYQIAFYLAFASIIGSAYLAHVLFFKIKDVCIVCTSVYIVNIILAILLWKVAF